ncbi:MAG: hypothetical protein ACR2P7_09030 [bacterium]
MTFSFKGALGDGWRLFKARYRALLGATAAFGLALLIIDIVLHAVESPLLDLVVAVFLSGPLLAGLQFLALLHLRDQLPALRPGLRALLAGFARYRPLVGINAVLALAMIGWAALFLVGWTIALGGWSAGGAIIGALLATASTLGLAVVYVRLFFAPLLCVDSRRRLGFKASLATSWRLTGACFWRLLGVLLAVALLVATTAALLVLPLIFLGAPLAVAVIAAAYESIVGKAEIAVDESMLD